jgi:hypothetical protein
MDLFAVIQDENRLDSVRYVADDAESISKYAATFIRRLAGVFSNTHLQERWRTEFHVGDDGVSVIITSPFGRATGALSLVIADENYHTEGRWVIRKDLRDDNGASVAIKVASLRVLKTGHIFLGPTQLHALTAANRIFGDAEDETAYKVALAILHSIGRTE